MSELFALLGYPEVDEQIALFPDEMAETQLEAGRDRALDFHWGVSTFAVSRTGWIETNDLSFDRAMRSVMAALVIAHRANDGWVSYSRRPKWYSNPARYRSLDYTYVNLKKIVEILLNMELIEEVRACRGDHIRTKKQSKMRATAALINAFNDVEFSYDPIETIRLKDAKGILIDYKEIDKTREMRKEIEAINTFFTDVKIVLPDECIFIGDYMIKVGDAIIRTTPSPMLYRVFNRSRWDANGRLYWWGQNLPADIRRKLLINDQRVVECDYKALHPTMLYAQRGIKLGHDPYLIAGYERKLCKQALLVALNAKTRDECISALVGAKNKKWPYKRDETDKLVRAIIEHNAPIRDSIASDAGIALMHSDSKIALRIVKSCHKAGFPCLPIHDSFIVPSSHEAELRQFMDAALQWYADGVRPRPGSALTPCESNENAGPRSTNGEQGGRDLYNRVDYGCSVVEDPAAVSEKRSGAKPASRSAILPNQPSTRVESPLLGAPKYDHAEAKRRKAAFHADLSSEYFPVPGEVEALFYSLYPFTWREVLQRLEEEETALRRYCSYEFPEKPRTPTVAEREANMWLPWPPKDPTLRRTFDPDCPCYTLPRVRQGSSTTKIKGGRGTGNERHA